jgi:hypothetical protein
MPTPASCSSSFLGEELQQQFFTLAELKAANGERL